MEKEAAKDLLKRYRLGQCTKREIEIINQWYRSFDGEDIDLSNDLKLSNTKKEMMSNISESILEVGRKDGLKLSSQKPVIKLYSENFKSLRRIAAVFLVFAIALSLFFYNQQIEPIAETDESLQEAPVKKELPSIIYLSDGSKVKLKEGSRLEYPVSFSGDTREVTLVGEAFFEVAKNKDKPFIIHSANLTTKVLGTSFNIKAYEGDESTEVAVVTGKVSVSVNKRHLNSDDEIEELVLKPNQKAIYSRREDHLIQAELMEEIQDQSDKKAKLIFNETSLEEIIGVLNIYYDANIKLGNEKMKSCLITAELTDEPIEVSLKIITKAIGAQYEIKDEEIILVGKGCGLIE